MSDMGPCCGRCYMFDVELFPANCWDKPERLKGQAIGQYHCGDCGAMVMGGIPHFKLCKLCIDREHPAWDKSLTKTFIRGHRLPKIHKMTDRQMLASISITGKYYK